MAFTVNTTLLTLAVFFSFISTLFSLALPVKVQDKMLLWLQVESMQQRVTLVKNTGAVTYILLTE